MRISSPRPEVLIVHARGRWSGLPRLPKICHRAGAQVTVFAPVGTEIWKARYVDRRIAAPPEQGLFSSALREHLSRERNRYDWVLVGDENAVVELATQPDASWLVGWFPVDPNPTSLELITSKAAFTVAAAAAGVGVPASHICNSMVEAKAAADAIGFPVMLKAAQGFAGNGVRKAQSLSELITEFSDLKDRVPIVVQKFEVGRVGSTQVFFDHGRLACWASSYKLACFPEPFGPSSARELMLHPDMEQTLAGIGKITGFHGLCGVDWLHRQSDGALLVLEFNPRPAPVVHMGHFSGVDFAAAIGDMLAGRKGTRRPVDVGPRKLFLFPQHPVRCIEKRYWRDLIYWLPGVSYNDVPWDQPRLLSVHLRMLATRLFNVLRHKTSAALGRKSNQRLNEAKIMLS